MTSEVVLTKPTTKTQKKKNCVKEFFNGVKKEIHKISWLSKNQVLKNTFVTIVVTIILAIIIGCVDIGMEYFINFIASLI